MRPVLYIQFLLLFATIAPLEGEQQQFPSSPVALYTSFQHVMPGAAATSMRQELEYVTYPVGIKLSWRDYLSSKQYPAVARLAVVHFKGRCDAKDLTVFHQYPWKLGWTHTSDNQIIPYVDIFCDAIRAHIAAHLSTIPSGDRERVFGRAVGRVLAHELYHVFAETKKHGSSGLAKAHCVPQDLVSEEFHFGDKELRKLRSVLAQTVLISNSAGPASESETAFASYGCVGCHGRRAEGTTAAPAIQAARMPNDVVALRAKLTNTSSEMHRRSRKFDLGWTKLSTNDLRTLLGFLKTKTAAAVSLEAK
jgi:hypothetical protein